MFLSVRSYNFRNLANSRLSTDARNIYLIGENGQGKSNFLELIYLLCFGGSFRTHQDELLITQGQEDMMVEGAFLDKNSQQNTISCKLEKDKERKEIRQNGKIVADRKDLIENIPCIVFKHEDIYFVNGTPERRRLFFNQVMGIYDIPFLEKFREYNKILRMRNVVLKEKKLDFLPVLDRQLAKQSLTIQPVLEISRTDIITTLLESGEAVSFLPDLVTRHKVAEGSLVYLNVPEVNLDIWQQLIYHRNKWISQALDTFLRYVAEKEFNS